MQELDFIGVAHYRRYLSNKKKASDLKDVLKEEDIQALLSCPNVVVLPKKTTYFTSIEKHYVRSKSGYEKIHQKDIDRLRQAVADVDPGYSSSLDKVLSGRQVHLKNMFIMSSSRFDAYCGWLFKVADRVAELSASREDQRRYVGALSEFLIDVYVLKNKIQVQEAEMLETERISFARRAFNAVKRKVIR